MFLMPFSTDVLQEQFSFGQSFRGVSTAAWSTAAFSSFLSLCFIIIIKVFLLLFNAEINMPWWERSAWLYFLYLSEFKFIFLRNFSFLKIILLHKYEQLIFRVLDSLSSFSQTVFKRWKQLLVLQRSQQGATLVVWLYRIIFNIYFHEYCSYFHTTLFTPFKKCFS